MTVRIIIVEKSARTRGFFRSAVRTQPGLCLVGEFEKPAGLSDIRDLAPDVICLGASIAQTEPVKRLLQEFPRASVIQVFPKIRANCINEALKSGVRGYILESSLSGEILTAIHGVINGGYYSSPRISSFLIDAYKNVIASRFAGTRQTTRSPGASQTP
jgi:DNA-binding NarL/FixJ family response regulator